MEMKCQWIKGRYDGQKAEYIQALADQGMGYIILEKGKEGNKNYIVAACLQKANQPLKVHLAHLTKYELEKVEKIYNLRNPLLC